MLTIRDVAAVLKVNRETVRLLCRRGELPSLRVSNAIRILPGDLEAFARSGRGCGVVFRPTHAQDVR
jgi:excisionase family DNA binding protein